MKYFKVPQEKAGSQFFTSKGRISITLVANELLTPKECEQHGINTKKLQEVEVSRKKTYWLFGARFELKD